jgi:hypothetical protein
VGAGITVLGTPVGIGMLHPALGEIIAAIEVMMMLTIFGTALFGSPVLTERAFRLLRWIGNRPEPPGPGQLDQAVWFGVQKPSFVRRSAEGCLTGGSCLKARLKTS